MPNRYNMVFIKIKKFKKFAPLAHLKAIPEDTLWESIKVSVVPTKHFPALAAEAESVNNTSLQLTRQHVKPVKYSSK